MIGTIWPQDRSTGFSKNMPMRFIMGKTFLLLPGLLKIFVVNREMDSITLILAGGLGLMQTAGIIQGMMPP